MLRKCTWAESVLDFPVYSHEPDKNGKENIPTGCSLLPSGRRGCVVPRKPSRRVGQSSYMEILRFAHNDTDEPPVSDIKATLKIHSQRAKSAWRLSFTRVNPPLQLLLMPHPTPGQCFQSNSASNSRSSLVKKEKGKKKKMTAETTTPVTTAARTINSQINR
jgi:hypothetical protein